MIEPDRARVQADTALGGGPLTFNSRFGQANPETQKRVDQLEARQREEDARYRERRERMQPYEQRYMESLDPSTRPAPPVTQNVGPPPDQRQYQQYAMQYTAAMALIGAFAGRITRSSANVSLNSFASALNGWQQGSQSAYENGMKQWEQSTRQTIENNRQSLEAYDRILKDRSLTQSERREQMTVAAVQYKDDMMYQAARDGRDEQMFKLRDINWENTFGDKGLERVLKTYEEPIREYRAKQQLISDVYAPIAANGWVDPATGQPVVNTRTKQPLTDGEKAQIQNIIETYPPGGSIGGDKGPPLTQQALETLVERRLSGEPKNSVLAKVGYGVQGRADIARFENLYAKVAAERGITPEMQNQADAQLLGQRAGARSTGVTAANLEMIIRNAHEALPDAVAASEKVPRGRWTAWNKIKQKALGEISDPDMKEFKQTNLQLAELWARAMNPKGVMRESDRDFALDVLNTADGPEAYKRATIVLNRFLEREYKAVQDQKAGKPLEHFDPETGFAREFQASRFKAEITGGAGGGAGAGAGGQGGGGPAAPPSEGWGAVRSGP